MEDNIFSLLYDDEEIAFTKVKLRYGWLASMAAYPIEYEGKIWKTAEALFQALRFNEEGVKEAIRTEASATYCQILAKKLAKTYQLKVEPMSEQDVTNMELVVRLKAEQHPLLLRELIKTKNRPIYEDNTKRGPKLANLFWGAIKTPEGWVGKNNLGKIWEKLRAEKIAQYTVLDEKTKLFLEKGIGEDPYAKLKAAYDNGEQIQELNLDTMRWVDVDWWKPTFTAPVANYRIKNEKIKDEESSKFIF